MFSKKQAIIVLSGGITKQGKLPFFVKRRLNYAYKFFVEGVSRRIILSGKYSYLYEKKPTKTEAEAMAEYLINMGIPAESLYRETYSRDLLSSAYYLKTKFLIPRRWKKILIVSSDFQEDRVKYVFNKVLGEKFSPSFYFATSHLNPTLLWQIFLFEKKTLLLTKAFLRSMKKGDHRYLTHRLFNAPFYREKRAGYVRQLVSEGKISRPVGVGLHYSLKKIFDEKQAIFAKYQLTPGKFPRGSKADFWSGRYLNFLGRNPKKETFALKFALRARDKEKFKKEIAITKELASKQLDFVPVVVEYNFQKAPIWYLYKVVKGRIAGRFSLDFSFAEHFYTEYTIKSFVNNLRQFHNIRKISSVKLPEWRSKTYKKFFHRYHQTAISNKKLPQKLIEEAGNFFDKNSKQLNQVNLYFSHNDLHPANIICSPQKKKLYFIDFEHAGWNNVAFDFCFAYLFSWENKNYQQKLYQAYFDSLTSIQKEEFKKVFPVTYLFFLIWLLHYLIGWKHRVQPERRHQTRKAVIKELDLLIKNHYSVQD